MKKRKIKTILIMLMIIFIIGLIFSKNKSLSYITRYCPECNRRMDLHREEEEHVYICPEDGYIIYEEHYGGEDHYSDGRCRVCDMSYARHEMEFETYQIENNVHVRVERCRVYNKYTNRYLYTCRERKYYPEDHTGGTHENNGRCTVCGYQYQQHTITNVIVDYDRDRK